MRYEAGYGIKAPRQELLAFLSGCQSRAEALSMARAFLDKAALLLSAREPRSKLLDVSFLRGEVTVWSGGMRDPTDGGGLGKVYDDDLPYSLLRQLNDTNEKVA